MNSSIESRPNVLLIVLDSVRADKTSLYNYERETTPFLETLAGQSTVYEQARAPSIWSLPSHVSIFTGEPPHVHGVNTGNQALAPGYTIWEELNTKFGYSTGLFTSNVYLTEVPTGLNTTFETVIGRDKLVPYPDALTPSKAEASSAIRYVKACLDHDEPFKSFINGATAKGQSIFSQRNIFNNFLPEDECTTHSENFQEWVGHQAGSWAACINFMDAHLPYNPTEEFNKWGDSELDKLQTATTSFWDFVNGDQPWWKCEALSNLYDGAILQMDNEVENIIEHLKRIGEFDNTHIVITGDHGEGFGEYCYARTDVRYTAHAYGINDALLHVPLLSKKPGQQKDRRVQDLASLTSFYDVVRSTADLQASDESFNVDKAYVSSIERTQQLKKHLPEGSKYRGDAFAIYRNGGDNIRKFVKWGSDEVEVSFARTPQAPVLSVEREGHDVVDQMLEKSETTSLRRCSNVSDDLDGDVMRRLEDLGYA